MMGERQVDQAALFYEFSLERHVPRDHLLRSIDRFVDLEGVRAHVAPFYSPIGRPSVDPELPIRLVGYCFGIRSERRLCESFAVDASLIKADANRQRSGRREPAAGGGRPRHRRVPGGAGRRTRGWPSSPTPPTTLIDVDHAVIVDVEASTAVRQAEVTAACTMIERVHDRFGLWPERLAADSTYGSAQTLNWLVHERGIEPHIPVMDKSIRQDGTFSRGDFTYDHAADLYRCPGGNELKQYRRAFRADHPDVPPDDTYRYRASKADCDACSLKSRCCPNTPARKVTRSIYEGARDFARDIAQTDDYVISRRERKKVEMLSPTSSGS